MRLATALLIALGLAGASAAAEPAPAPETPAEVLTLDEAAALLRIAPETLEVESEAGRVPGRRIGAEWRFARAALLAWLSGSAPAAESLPAPELAALTGRGEEGAEPAPPIGEPPTLERADEVFLRDQRLLLAPGNLVVEPAASYTRSDSRELALTLAGTTGVLDLEERTGAARLTLRYGLLEETELFGEYAYAREDRTASFFGLEGGDTDELKSFSLGLRRTLLHERPGIPNLVLLLGWNGPISNTSAGFTTGLAAVSSFDPAILFGGVQYERRFAREFDDFALLEHDHNLVATFGYAFALNEELTLSASLLGVYGSQTTFRRRVVIDDRDNPGTKKVTFPDLVLDSEEQYYLRLGMTRMLSPGRYVEPSVTYLLSGKESKVSFGLSFPFLIDRGERGG